MTKRIRLSHPLVINGIQRKVGATLDVDDDFANRAVVAGLAKIATAAKATPAKIDPQLDLALAERYNHVRNQSRLPMDQSPKLGAVSADITSVLTNQAPDAVTFNRVYNVDGSGGAAGLLRDYCDVGEGLDLTSAGYQFGFGPYNASPRSIRVMCDGDKFAWTQSNGAGGLTGVSVYVDGRPTNAANTYLIGNAQTFNIINFPSAKPRLIEVRTWAGILALHTQKPYDLWKPTPRRGPRVLIIGDGQVGNAGTTNAIESCYWNIGPHIGSDDVWVDYYAGSGYGVHSSANGTDVPGTGANRFLDRVTTEGDGTVIVNSGLSWDVGVIKPEMVVVHGGGANDKFKGRTNAEVIDDVVETFSRLRDALPNARLVFVEGLARPVGYNTFDADYVAIRTDAQEELADTGVYFVDVATTRPWIRGTGYAGATTGVDNSDLYVSSNGSDFTNAGHLYLRRRMGERLRTILADDGSRLNTLI